MSMKDMKITVEVQKNGRVTIPKTMRKLFDIKDGDFLTLLIIEKQRKFEKGRDYEEYPYVFLPKEEWLNEQREQEKRIEG